MKFRSALTTAAPLVVAAALVVGLAGCSTSSTGTAAGTKTSTPTPTVAAKTYTADDLSTILKTAQSKLGVTGTLLDNAQVQAALEKAGGAGGISTLLSDSGVTFSPASCAADIKTVLSATPPTGTVEAALSSGTTTISLATIAGKPLPSTLYSNKADQTNKVLSDCSKVTMNVKPTGATTSVAVGLQMTKADVTTNADKTYALDESVTLPAAAGASAGTTDMTVVTAVSGNLLISVQTPKATAGATATPSATPAPSAADAVNAVIAAAK